jgi:hypothetical protein
VPPFLFPTPYSACVAAIDVGYYKVPESNTPSTFLVPLASDPHLSPPVQGYKMDDLLSSYVHQFLSAMNKQQSSGATVLTSF